MGRLVNFAIVLLCQLLLGCPWSLPIKVSLAPVPEGARGSVALNCGDENVKVKISALGFAPAAGWGIATGMEVENNTLSILTVDFKAIVLKVNDSLSISPIRLRVAGVGITVPVQILPRDKKKVWLEFEYGSSVEDILLSEVLTLKVADGLRLGVDKAICMPGSIYLFPQDEDFWREAFSYH